MKQFLSPTLSDLRLECVLMQAWKKSSAYLRSHSWYADVLEIDYQSLRIPELLKEVQAALREDADWTPDRLELVPAPKTQRWTFGDNRDWKPRKDEKYQNKIRPLAHVSLRDQIVASGMMLCLADRVENRMGDPRLPIELDGNRRRVLGYGHRLVCDGESAKLRHRWGSSKLYRQYFQDYQTFLRRPRVVASDPKAASTSFEIAIVQSDLSKFYDRVQPSLLHQKLLRLCTESDDPEFFNLAKRVFDWRWSDTQRAERHATEHELPEFMQVALPQGLVASGFFANVVMQDFEDSLRAALDTVIDQECKFTLLDAAYYVDDLRLVVQIPRTAPTIPEETVRDSVANWLQDLLDKTAPGLRVEREKTAVTVEGRDKRFLVPQSRAAQRIQSDTSGVFDVLHGTELIGAIEGFFHTQKRYSTEGEPEEPGRSGLLLGLSDMRDETAARFAAGRFRKSFRSLRPMLDADGPEVPRTAEEASADLSADGGEQTLVLSQVQLDERAKLFAALLIEEWAVNPANVRLLRVALDMYPDPLFLEEVLRLLEPGWRIAGAKGALREIRLYCLAELFRAGATETGIVSDQECLPSGVSVADYHARLLREAKAVFALFAKMRSSDTRLPWYLMQQVFLYLSARAAFPLEVDRKRARGGPLLKRYWQFARLLRGDQLASTEVKAILLAIGATGFSHTSLVGDAAQRNVSPNLLARVASCSPRTAALLWKSTSAQAGDALTKMAEHLGLKARGLGTSPKLLSDLAVEGLNPFLFEPNLLRLAEWLLSLDSVTFSTPLTPWQIVCNLKPEGEGHQGARLDPGSFRVNRSLNTGSQLFAPPEWCESDEERQRFQIGSLLRFAIRGTTDFYSPAMAQDHAGAPRYTRSVSHWQQQRYSGFQGRAAFGQPWIPISSFVEDLLYELLRWPGSGTEAPGWTVRAAGEAVARRLTELEAEFGAHSQTLFLRQSANPPRRTATASAWGRPLRIGIVQTVTPDLADYARFASSPELSSEPNFRRRHRAHLAAALAGVAQMQRVRDTHRSMTRSDGQNLDLLVLPELAVHPNDVGPLLVPFVRKHKCILLFGMVYHRTTGLLNNPLINSCQWIIPEWDSTRGLQLKTLEQGKLHLIEAERSLTPTPVGFRPAQWLVEYKWGSSPDLSPLVITASVCYDATDLDLAADLRSRSDLYIICALNRDVGTFDRMSEALHYHMYQGVLLVNNGQFGASSFFMPFEKPHHRQVFHLHGQPQVAVAFAEICPRKLVERPRGSGAAHGLQIGTGVHSAPPEGSWKTIPAGWRSRGSPTPRP